MSADTKLKTQEAGRSDLTTKQLETNIAQTIAKTTNIGQDTATSATQAKLNEAKTVLTNQELEVAKVLLPFIQSASSGTTQVMKYLNEGKLGDAAYWLISNVKEFANQRYDDLVKILGLITDQQAGLPIRGEKPGRKLQNHEPTPY